MRLGRRPSGSTKLSDTDALLLQPPVYLTVVDHKTSTQITQFRLTSHGIISTYQLYYPLLYLQHLFRHCIAEYFN